MNNYTHTDQPHDLCVCGSTRANHTDPNAAHQFELDVARLQRAAEERRRDEERRKLYYAEEQAQRETWQRIREHAASIKGTAGSATVTTSGYGPVTVYSPVWEQEREPLVGSTESLEATVSQPLESNPRKLAVHIPDAPIPAPQPNPADRIAGAALLGILGLAVAAAGLLWLVR